MKVAIDEQIFALQRHGGISRLFFELISQYVTDPTFNIDVLPFDRPIINEYVLANNQISDHLHAVASDSTLVGLFKQAAPGKFDNKQRSCTTRSTYHPAFIATSKQRESSRSTT